MKPRRPERGGLCLRFVRQHRGPARPPARIHSRSRFQSSVLFREGPPSLRPHARGRRPGLQHPVSLLQSQIRLLQRVAPRRRLGGVDAGPGGEKDQGGRGQHPADDRPGHRRPGRSAGQPGADLRHLPHVVRAGARHQAVRLDERPGPARQRGRAGQGQHRARHHHDQLRRSRCRGR